MPIAKRRITRLGGAICALLMFGAMHVARADECFDCSDPLHPRNQYTPVGSDVVVVDTDSFFSEATEVVTPGSTDADFCVARDPREVDLSPTKHIYVPRQLALRELAGKDGCAGTIPTDNAGRTSWEQLLGQIDLRIDPWYRTFKGTYNGVVGYWLVVGVVRSSAEFRGPVVSLPFPENLVDYSGFNTLDVKDGLLTCVNTLDQRPVTLSGNVTAFGEPANVEGNRMIMDTAQCDGNGAASRRSTHVFKMRLDGRYLSEAINIVNELSGLYLTINQAGRCVNSASQSAIASMRNLVGATALAILRRQWDTAVADCEQIARLAHDDVNFDGCGDHANYEGALMSRALICSFTVFDRFKHRDPNTWETYFIPSDLDVPVLLSDGETE